MEAVVHPEPPPDEREALLRALQEADPEPYERAWREAALLEGTESDEP